MHARLPLCLSRARTVLSMSEAGFGPLFWLAFQDHRRACAGLWSRGEGRYLDTKHYAKDLLERLTAIGGGGGVTPPPPALCHPPPRTQIL